MERVGCGVGSISWTPAPSRRSIRYADNKTAISERDPMLPPAFTKWLSNHIRPNDVTEGYAAD